jgi:hypothetical protein
MEAYLMDLPSISKEYLTHVDATPNREYPLRILRAYRQNCDCKWVGDPNNPIYELMNQRNDQRAKILDEAIAILEKHFNIFGRVVKAATKVFNWYYIFGEDNSAARGHLAELGNALRDGGYLNQKKEEKDG